MVKDTFRFPTFLLIGALLQIAVFTVIPSYRLAILPAIALLGKTVIRTLRQQRGKDPLDPDINPFMRSVHVGRTTAQLPDATTGLHGSTPSARPVVLLHLGVRINHPLGFLAPGAGEVIKFFRQCSEELASSGKAADTYGMLGVSTWRAAERESNNTLLLIYYFRDFEGLHRFAHGEAHRKAWDWCVRSAPKYVGIFHEAFEVPAGAHESIYVNCAPTLMGATSVRVAAGDSSEGDGKGTGEVWVNSLVSADTPILHSQLSRLRRTKTALKA